MAFNDGPDDGWPEDSEDWITPPVEGVRRCVKCGAWEDEPGMCVRYEYGPGNSASPSGAYPVPNGDHVFAFEQDPRE